HIHAVLPAPPPRDRSGGAADGDLVGSPARRRVPGAVDRRSSLAVRADLHRPRLRRPSRAPEVRGRVRAARRRHRHGGARPDRRRRPALHRRRHRLRVPAARPVAPVLRVPRGVPLLHGAGVPGPLRRHLPGDVLPPLIGRESPHSGGDRGTSPPPASSHPAMADEKTHTLNYPTVVAGAVAAATAHAISSQLGLLGTILGAAVASVVSAVVTNALGGWIAHLHGATRDREPPPLQRLLVGVAAITLVVLAFHTGLGLVTAGVPADSFAGRLAAQVGLR